MGRKSHDHEASGSREKKEPSSKTPVLARIARLLHANWEPVGENWTTVHPPGGGWRLSEMRVPVPPVPAREP